MADPLKDRMDAEEISPVRREVRLSVDGFICGCLARKRDPLLDIETVQDIMGSPGRTMTI